MSDMDEVEEPWKVRAERLRMLDTAGGTLQTAWKEALFMRDDEIAREYVATGRQGQLIADAIGRSRSYPYNLYLEHEGKVARRAANPPDQLAILTAARDLLDSLIKIAESRR